MEQTSKPEDRFVVLGTLGSEIIHTSDGVTPKKPSGTAFYSATVLSALGRSPHLVTGVPQGYSYPTALQQARKDLVFEDRAAVEFFWEAEYDVQLEMARTLAFDGSIYESKAAWWKAHKDILAGVTHAYLGAFDPQLQLEFADDLPTNSLVLMETISHWIKLKPTLFKAALSKAQLFVINARECSDLFGIRPQPYVRSTSIQELLAFYGLNAVFVTFGSAGSSVYCDAGYAHIPAPSTIVRDTTGAGNVFGASVLEALSREQSTVLADLTRATAFGNVLASAKCGHFEDYAPCINRREVVLLTDYLIRDSFTIPFL